MFKTTTTATPLQAVSGLCVALDYAAHRIADYPAVRSLLKTPDIVIGAGEVSLQALLGGAKNLPALWMGPGTGESGPFGTGRGDGRTSRRYLDLVVGVAVRGADPQDCLKVWDAVEAAVDYRYFARIPELWDAGIVRIFVSQPAHAAVANEDLTRSAAIGMVRVEL